MLAALSWVLRGPIVGIIHSQSSRQTDVLGNRQAIEKSDHRISNRRSRWFMWPQLGFYDA